MVVITRGVILKKDHSAHTANRKSKLDYLQSISVSIIKKSPYYWIAFVYFGQIEADETNGTVLYYFIGILALLIVLFLWRRKRKTHNLDDGY